MCHRGGETARGSAEPEWITNGLLLCSPALPLVMVKLELLAVDVRVVTGDSPMLAIFGHLNAAIPLSNGEEGYERRA